VGAWDPKVRLEVLDECGIDAQVIFPSTIGLGGQDLGAVADESLCRAAVEIYNDGMAEIQEESGNRLLPMPLMPAWDVQASVAEVERVAAMGARGVNMTSDPQDLGAPDLASTEWDPFWEACAGLQLPVHFHIGASVTGMTFYGKYPWESHALNTKLAIGGTLLFIGNARVVTNLILSGIFDRHPDLQTVSVESGVGWIPFILEALDYEMSENAPPELAAMDRLPSEYFRTNMYATFWFENNRNKLPNLVESVGEDRILFETDFPHPTCLYPEPLQTVQEKMSTLSPEAQAKIYGENARHLYRL
jgi:predicted TIM-barrel fold metal-dependent hydrolase